MPESDPKETVWRKLKEILLSQNPGRSDLTLSSHLYNDLGYDSLRTMVLIFAVEKEFGIEIRGDDLEQGALRTPASFIELILERKSRHS